MQGWHKWPFSLFSTTEKQCLTQNDRIHLLKIALLQPTKDVHKINFKWSVLHGREYWTYKFGKKHKTVFCKWDKMMILTHYNSYIIRRYPPKVVSLVHRYIQSIAIFSHMNPRGFLWNDPQTWHNSQSDKCGHTLCRI